MYSYSGLRNLRLDNVKQVSILQVPTRLMHTMDPKKKAWGQWLGPHPPVARL